LKNFVLHFLIISHIGFSQENILSKEAEEIIDELFYGELFERTKTDFVYSSLNYNSNTYFSGREASVDQFNFSPQITYLNTKGFFATLTGIYLSEVIPAWDLTALSIGYYFNIESVSDKINFNTSYSRYFYSQTSDNFVNSLILGGSYFSNDEKFFLNINSNYFFGGESFFQVTTNALYSFNIIGESNEDDYIDGTAELIGKRTYQGEEFSLKFNPRISFIISQENINPEYYFYKEFLDSGELPKERHLGETLFGLINTQFRFPIYIEMNRFSIEASYSINFPRDILKKETLSTTGFFSLTIGHLFSF